jgi:transposase
VRVCVLNNRDTRDPAPLNFRFDRKSRQRNKIVAIKALAHKLANASYFILRDQVAFDPKRLFVQ